MQIFVFNCANQRLRRFTSGVIYADSYPNIAFKFNFNTPDWDISSVKTAVFSCNGQNYNEPLDENNMCKVPEEVLHPGYFKVSVHDDQCLMTNALRLAAEPLPADIEPDGGNVGSGVVFVPEIDERKILSWTVKDVGDDLTPPPPTDLNPYDEWAETGNEVVSEYIWEPIQ